MSYLQQVKSVLGGGPTLYDKIYNSGGGYFSTGAPRTKPGEIRDNTRRTKVKSKPKKRVPTKKH